MRYTIRFAIFALVCFVMLPGCGGAPVPAPAVSIDGNKYILAQEPPGAKDVKALRGNAKDGDSIVVVGRIGGQAKPWIEGRAGFWIVDTSFKPCNEREDDNCKT